jgi:hypothetical protein
MDPPLMVYILSFLFLFFFFFPFFFTFFLACQCVSDFALAQALHAGDEIVLVEYPPSAGAGQLTAEVWHQITAPTQWASGTRFISYFLFIYLFGGVKIREGFSPPGVFFAIETFLSFFLFFFFFFFLFSSELNQGCAGRLRAVAGVEDADGHRD